MVVDLHVHTSIGSLDSGISPPRLLEAAYEVGLDGLAITEHSTPWSAERIERFRQASGLFVCGGREWSTDVGHIIALGINHAEGEIRQAEELRRLVLAEGGFMILTHPFRFFPGPSNFLFGRERNPSSLTAEELARHPVFELVDEIEVLNYGCTDRENQVAQEVARALGKPGVAGSDAHSYTEVGRCVTIFERTMESEEELVAELRAGRYCVAQRRPNGDYVPLG
ncbi:MAG: PHP domain-containing protein [Chloroflexota bacterium]|nr:PHP domain-containing protein [Chloroflexota bacterium]